MIQSLRERMSEEDLKDLPAPVIQPGTVVTVTEGPFKDIEAMVAGVIPGKDRVKLLLEFLGRQLTVDVPAYSVFIDTESPKRKVWE